MLATLPLMSQRAMSTPLTALLRTGPLGQYEFTIITCQRSSMLAGSRPRSSGSRYSSTAWATRVQRWVKVAQPRPYRPGWSVSTLTTTRAMPAGGGGGALRGGGFLGGGGECQTL